MGSNVQKRSDNSSERLQVRHQVAHFALGQLRRLAVQVRILILHHWRHTRAAHAVHYGVRHEIHQVTFGTRSKARARHRRHGSLQSIRWQSLNAPRASSNKRRTTARTLLKEDAFHLERPSGCVAIQHGARIRTQAPANHIDALGRMRRSIFANCERQVSTHAL